MKERVEFEPLHEQLEEGQDSREEMTRGLIVIEDNNNQTQVGA